MKSLAKEFLSEGKRLNYSDEWILKWDKELESLEELDLVKFKNYCEVLFDYMSKVKSSHETQKSINKLDGRF